MNAMNPQAYSSFGSFVQGSNLASQQASDGIAQQRAKDEQAMRAIQLVGSIALGAKGGQLDGAVDPAKFEQGLDFLQQNGMNVSRYRNNPAVADIAARASMTALQQIQGGMAAQQAVLGMQSTLMQIQQRQQEIGLQARRDARQERAEVRQEATAGLPQGYRMGASGQAERIPGLPPQGEMATPQSAIGKLNADLAAGRITREQFDIEQERITKAAESPIPQNVITSLNTVGKNLTDVDRFVRTFDPNFAGYRVNALGEAAMTAGRMGVGTENMARGAQWWQDYAKYRNSIRNELFGSALTAPEARAFEQADIQPGMAPDQIRQNLQRQQEAARSAAKKLAAPHIAAGKSADQIEAALGFSLSDLGIERPSRRQSPQPPARGQSSPQAPTQQAAAPSPSATPAAAPGRQAGDVLGPAPAGMAEGRTGNLNGVRVVIRNGQVVVAE